MEPKDNVTLENTCTAHYKNYNTWDNFLILFVHMLVKNDVI